MKKILIPIIFICLGTIAPLLLLETSLRVELLLRKGIPLSQNPRDLWDKDLGWTGREHLIAGSDTLNPVLIFGDSFTHGLSIPTDKMWFASLQTETSSNPIIAYGGLGYGTLQELLVLRKYLQLYPHPELIVLQLCSNDILNNYQPIEQETYLQRAPGPRPYLEGKEIHIRMARKYGSIIFPFISFSRFLYKYNTRWENLMANWAHEGKIDSIEFPIENSHGALPIFKDAVKVTQRLIRLFKKEAAGIPLVFMLVDDLPTYSKELIFISKKFNIPLVIPSRIQHIPENGRLEDGTHLNELGNQIVGKIVSEFIHEQGLLGQTRSHLKNTFEMAS
ncbi:MAG: SGNH/GDSL hydrolase family protein [Bdellovibrionales bacterium]|nr:SGNH/GDSL hydrolase family protein [Bdellovibrionales bacterium]